MLASAAGSIQRAPARHDNGAGILEAVVQVTWSDDSWDFEDRVVSAVAHSHGFRAVPRSSLPFALNHAAATLHGSLEHRSPKPGQRIRVRVSANYDPDNIPEFTDVHLTIPESEPARTEPATQPAGPEPTRSPTPSPVGAPGSRHPSLRDQRDSLQRLFSLDAAQADRNGWSGMTFTVANNGRALSPIALEMLEPRQGRPAGMAPLSVQAAARALDSFLDVVMEAPGRWTARFVRDASGAMHFQSWERLPEVPQPPQPAPSTATSAPRSQAEEFEAETGMVYPPRINKALQAIAIQGLHEADPFSLKNLPYTIAGVVIPIGAMKLISEPAAVGNIVRLEWQLDEDIVEGSETGTLKPPGSPEQPAGGPSALRDLKTGDVIPTPAGRQRVVEIKGPRTFVTEPVPESEAGETAQTSTTAPTEVSTPAAAKRLTAADIAPGMEIDPARSQIFRGGDSFELRPDEYKLDPKTRDVKPTHGPSLDADPASPNLKRFGGARQIKSIPPELRLVQRGQRIEHFEIVPRAPMSVERYQQLLRKIVLW